MAKIIMVQGTMSNVGKSLITAGLCRVFTQDGYRTAPFKSQNMALNSFITRDGLEMGRAQVMQAEACNIEPNVCMNPILLKPSSDIGSQVIVNGKVVETMTAKAYFQYKKKLIPEIKKAFSKLANQVDIIVIEGAGSPAEINLKADDIVNMGLARMLDAPVLLVGDIDRGGVFAQLYGTCKLLEDDENKRIKALIINKFRGDKTILEPGIHQIEELCQKKVCGVLPYTSLDIDDEDSLSERFLQEKPAAFIHISVIRFPKISNFTDFNALDYYQSVSVSYVTNPKQLEKSDLIILPGTKNTIQDMLWLRESGLESAIRKKASQGILIIGICGGYQILGNQISDSKGCESFGRITGMGLLHANTDFKNSKVRTRVCGRVNPIKGTFSFLSGCKFEGYEIHMGQTSSFIQQNNSFSIVKNMDNRKEEKTDGMVADNILGTYIHGIFDNPFFTQAIIKFLFQQKGIPFKSELPISRASYKAQQYDKLADMIRKNTDMDCIYQILNKEELF